MKKGILIGIAATLLAGLAGAYMFISLGLMPANADGKPLALETWAAQKSLHAAIDREAPDGLGPLPADKDNMLAGAALYKANCLVCHGGPDGKPSKISRGLYQRPPLFAHAGVDDDNDGEIYWIIKHGIRLTGMPAFGPTLTEDELWQATLFLKHLPHLHPKAEAVWKAMPSAEAAPAPAAAAGKKKAK